MGFIIRIYSSQTEKKNEILELSQMKIGQWIVHTLKWKHFVIKAVIKT